MATTTEVALVPTYQGATLITGGIFTVFGRINIDTGGALQFEGTTLTLNASEANSLDGVDTAWANRVPGTHAFTIGAEAGDVINVAVQLKDIKGINPTARRYVTCFLSDDAEGDGITAAAAGTIAIGTNGTIIEAEVANKKVAVMTNATGAFDLNITKTGAQSYYLIVVQGGIPQASSIITFAA